MSRLDDILMEHWSDLRVAESGSPGSRTKAHRRAVRKIQDVMLEIIGADEPVEGEDYFVRIDSDTDVSAWNKLRAELRQKVEEL